MNSKNNGLYVVGSRISRRTSKDISSAIIATNAIVPSGAIQIFTHGPRNLIRNKINYMKISQLSNRTKIFVHAPYPCYIFKGEQHAFDTMIEVFQAAHACNSSGVIMYLPRAKVATVTTNILRLLEMIDDEKIDIPIILETPNNKPHPSMSWESPEKLTALCDAFQDAGIASSRVGICINTAHIYASGMKITTRNEATIYLKKSPIEWIHIFHLNGNEYKYPNVGDKNAIPLSPLDTIWGGKKYKDSGCFEFVEWARGYTIPTIFEGKARHAPEDIYSFIQMCGRV